jgi:hypothetical protein
MTRSHLPGKGHGRRDTPAGGGGKHGPRRRRLHRRLNKRLPRFTVQLSPTTTCSSAGDACNQPPARGRRRRALLSLPKLLAEGSPDEIQSVLGWWIDTRRMNKALPDDKFQVWMGNIDGIIGRDKKCRYERLDQLVGRLNHSSFVMSVSRHFLGGRIRASLTPRLTNSRPMALTKEAVDDLGLWKEILTSANHGLSINLLVT